MRVLILNYEYPPLGGGAGVATAALASGLVKRGVTVDVVTSGCSGGRSALPGSAELEEQGRLRIYRVPSRRIGVHEAGMLGAASYLLHAFPLVLRLVRTHGVRRRPRLLLASHWCAAAIRCASENPGRAFASRLGRSRL